VRGQNNAQGSNDPTVRSQAGRRWERIEETPRARGADGVSCGATTNLSPRLEHWGERRTKRIYRILVVGKSRAAPTREAQKSVTGRLRPRTPSAEEPFVCGASGVCSVEREG